MAQERISYSTVDAGSSASDAVWASSCESAQSDTSTVGGLQSLFEVLPDHISEQLSGHPSQEDLVEIMLDLGKPPKALFGMTQEKLGSTLVSRHCLATITGQISSFGEDNRAGIQNSLHRVSCIRNRKGQIIGLTLRVGKPTNTCEEFLKTHIGDMGSVLVVGRPGVGKTSFLREITYHLSTKAEKRVMVIDTSNELGGGGDISHPAIGEARRMMIKKLSEQSEVMLEGVKNHTPEVIVVDEIGGKNEAISCQQIAQRGVRLISTVHGSDIESVINNPDLAPLTGGFQAVILSDVQAKTREKNLGCMFQKTKRELKGKPTFDTVIEMREKNQWVVHDTAGSIKNILDDRPASVQVFKRLETGSFQAEDYFYSKGGSLSRRI